MPWLLVFTVILSGCTEQEMAKEWGGTASIDIPCDQKLTMVTWKGTQIWYATRPMREGEVPETTTFKESSSFGLMEGVVTLEEKVCQAE
jgi:hypothetical protein